MVSVFQGERGVSETDSLVLAHQRVMGRRGNAALPFEGEADEDASAPRTEPLDRVFLVSLPGV